MDWLEIFLLRICGSHWGAEEADLVVLGGATGCQDWKLDLPGANQPMEYWAPALALVFTSDFRIFSQETRGPVSCLYVALWWPHMDPQRQASPDQGGPYLAEVLGMVLSGHKHHGLVLGPHHAAQQV